MDAVSWGVKIIDGKSTRKGFLRVTAQKLWSRHGLDCTLWWQLNLAWCASQVAWLKGWQSHREQLRLSIGKGQDR